MRTENEQRSDRAFRTVLAYAQWAGSELGHSWEETVITELFADLLVMVEEYSIDLDDCLRVAHVRYTKELEARHG